MGYSVSKILSWGILSFPIFGTYRIWGGFCHAAIFPWGLLSKGAFVTGDFDPVLM